MDKKQLKASLKQAFQLNFQEFLDVLVSAMNMEKEDGERFMRENMDYIVAKFIMDNKQLDSLEFEHLIPLFMDWAEIADLKKEKNQQQKQLKPPPTPSQIAARKIQQERQLQINRRSNQPNPPLPQTSQPPKTSQQPLQQLPQPPKTSQQPPQSSQQRPPPYNRPEGKQIRIHKPHGATPPRTSDQAYIPPSGNSSNRPQDIPRNSHNQGQNVMIPINQQQQRQVLSVSPQNRQGSSVSPQNRQGGDGRPRNIQMNNPNTMNGYRGTPNRAVQNMPIYERQVPDRQDRYRKFLSKLSECFDQPEKRHKLFQQLRQQLDGL